jgi:ubiquinone/menaquinone biosynthesis C-methylase UbiE
LILDDAAKDSSYWDDIYRENDVKTMSWFLDKLDHDVLNEIRSKNLNQGRFLDLGTGPGTQAMHLVTFGFEVTGSDISQSAIDKAKQQYSEPNFVVDNILRSKFPDDEFDFILDRGVFHTLEKEQIPSYLEQIKRILKENGLLFLKCMSKEEKGIPQGRGPTLYSQAQVRAFFEKDFEVESIKDSLFFGEVAVPYKAIFTVLRNKKN